MPSSRVGGQDKGDHTLRLGGHPHPRPSTEFLGLLGPQKDPGVTGSVHHSPEPSAQLCPQRGLVSHEYPALGWDALMCLQVF